jgi:hypothetical protein
MTLPTDIPPYSTASVNNQCMSRFVADALGQGLSQDLVNRAHFRESCKVTLKNTPQSEGELSESSIAYINKDRVLEDCSTLLPISHEIHIPDSDRFITYLKTRNSGIACFTLHLIVQAHYCLT